MTKRKNFPFRESVQTPPPKRRHFKGEIKPNFLHFVYLSFSFVFQRKKNTKHPLPNLFLRRIRFLHHPLYHHRTRWSTVREDGLFNPVWIKGY
ncbi:hypothetical protein ES332_A06G045100v1 [Gossypium tomentosum]|uniref:Uncharacterized protein n=1 Tax=Gossypium tomentosum TaxID=34277 RepID=A0A5D2PZN2_GOSTO|nr:hypothetical protein ES332_A06G045100v1 [Gossypium tomentosum]